MFVKPVFGTGVAVLGKFCERGRNWIGGRVGGGGGLEWKGSEVACSVGSGRR